MQDAAVIRETWEENGVKVRRSKLRAVHVMQHRNPEGSPRIGWFFVASEWDGEPVNNEPHKCAGLRWVPIDQLPDNTRPYTVAGLAHYRAGVPFALHGFTGNDGLC